MEEFVHLHWNQEEMSVSFMCLNGLIQGKTPLGMWQWKPDADDLVRTLGCFALMAGMQSDLAISQGILRSDAICMHRCKAFPV